MFIPAQDTERLRTPSRHGIKHVCPLSDAMVDSHVADPNVTVDPHEMVDSDQIVDSNVETDVFTYDSISETVVDTVGVHSDQKTSPNENSDAVTSMSLDSGDSTEAAINSHTATPMSIDSSDATSSMVTSDNFSDSSDSNQISKSLFSFISNRSNHSENEMTSEDERFEIEFAASRDSWSNDERNRFEETDSEEEDVSCSNPNFNFHSIFQKPKRKCLFAYQKDINVDGQQLKIKIECSFETSNGNEFLKHSKTCHIRYKSNMNKTNPSFLSKIIWESAITNGYGDHLAHEIQRSLLENREVKNLEVSDDLHTIKNCRIVKSPNFRDFLVLHRESSHNRRKSKDQCEMDEEVFRRLIPTASSVTQYGETNKVRFIFFISNHSPLIWMLLWP